MAIRSVSWQSVRDELPQAARPDGRLPLGNHGEAYDELVYILLTVMTRSQPRLDRSMAGLRELADDAGWTGLLAADLTELDDVLRPLGFVNRRREQLLGIAHRVEVEHGGSLDFLHDLSDEEALAYLCSLPGVGTKTAKCVLMYSLGRAVLPVDIHVLRVAKRLGLVPADASWKHVDEQLEVEVPDELKFDLHVQLVTHGREVCKSRNPQCDGCVLFEMCPTGHLAPRLRSDYVR